MLEALRRLLREEWGQAMRRGVFVGLGMAIAAGGMAIAYNANTGSVTTTTTTTTPPSGNGNVWMAPSGGITGSSTCTRSSSAITYAQAQAAYPGADYICGSVTNSCTAAAAGDTIQVVDGSYGDQTTGCQKTAWTTFRLSDGAVFTRAGPTNSGNQYIKYIGGTINVIQPCPSGSGFRGAANYEWFEANHFNNVGGSDPCWTHVAYFYGHDITVIGPGQFGPNTNWTGSGNPGVYVEGGTYNLLIQNTTFIDIDALHPSPNDHVEDLYIYGTGNTHDISIVGNRFMGGPNGGSYYGNDTTGTIFITGGNNYNITIRNNFFSSDRGGGPMYIGTQSPSVSVCDRYTIEYNNFNAFTSYISPLLFQCGSQQNFIFRGNVLSYPGCVGTSNTFNTYQYSGSQPSCGSNNTYVSGSTYGAVNNLGYVNASAKDLHITASSPARNAGDPSNFPALDIDGDLRPLPAGDNQNVDSGADEVN